MKTINGNNKLERQINKAKKYLNLDLVEWSNKYLKVVNNENIEGLYVIFKLSETSNYKLVATKNGELKYAITPLNSNNKTYWFQDWSCLKSHQQYLQNEYLIVRPFFENDKKELAELSQGGEDVYKLSDLLIQYNGLFTIAKQ